MITPKKLKIVSAFPGTGKSFYVKNCKNLTCLDSDSSKFSWDENKIRHSEWPNNYLVHIIKSAVDYDRIFISSHEEVRDGLFCTNIAFDLVYPHRSLKSEYLDRYVKRGSDKNFVNIMENKWDFFIDQLENETVYGNRHILRSNEFISDIYTR